MLHINYEKNKKKQLFKSISTHLGVHSLQYYCPVYSDFFTSPTHYFHSSKSLMRVDSVDEDDVVCTVKGINKPVSVFFKQIPLDDPYEYLIGNTNTLQLPTPKCYTAFEKSTYIDGLFYYLSSQLKEQYNLFGIVNYYGSYIGIADTYTFSLMECELEHLKSVPFYKENIGKLFSVETITILDELVDIHELIDADLDSTLADVTSTTEAVDLLEEVSEVDMDSVAVSVAVSETEEGEEGEVSETVSEADSDGCEYEDDVFIDIYKYPIQLLAIEKCEDTLDTLFVENKLADVNEFMAMMMQIIMLLALYQKVFLFTHNDLHTNNIMYSHTDAEWFYYKFQNVYYKVPTYGKEYKLIDFGRSVYTFNGIKYASKSFFKEQDAYGQYNTEPFYEENKPRIDENFSFDLCRLACSIYDYYFEEPTSPIQTPIQQYIYDLCLDDNGVNVLYTPDGNTTYPNFKLYKMIAKTVHNHTPSNQLVKPAFTSFITTEDVIHPLLNIDIFTAI